MKKILSKEEGDYILDNYSQMYNDNDFDILGKALKYDGDYCLLDDKQYHAARMVCFSEKIGRWPTLEDMEKN